MQTNPYYSYSIEKTIANASRKNFNCMNHNNSTNLVFLGIISLFKEFAPDLDSDRVCIKIPSTWEGIMACRSLELAGVNTLATTLFTLSQAILAAEVGCSYIAPYVNQLKVHFEPG